MAKKRKQSEAQRLEYSGRLRTRAEIAEIILSAPCWRKATVTAGEGWLLVRKGTAEMRLRVD